MERKKKTQSCKKLLKDSVQGRGRGTERECENTQKTCGSMGERTASAPTLAQRAGVSERRSITRVYAPTRTNTHQLLSHSLTSPRESGPHLAPGPSSLSLFPLSAARRDELREPTPNRAQSSHALLRAPVCPSTIASLPKSRSSRIIPFLSPSLSLFIRNHSHFSTYRLAFSDKTIPACVPLFLRCKHSRSSENAIPHRPLPAPHTFPTYIRMHMHISGTDERQSCIEAKSDTKSNEKNYFFHN